MLRSHSGAHSWPTCREEEVGHGVTVRVCLCMCVCLAFYLVYLIMRWIVYPAMNITFGHCIAFVVIRLPKCLLPFGLFRFAVDWSPRRSRRQGNVAEKIAIAHLPHRQSDKRISVRPWKYFRLP